MMLKKIIFSVLMTLLLFNIIPVFHGTQNVEAVTDAYYIYERYEAVLDDKYTAKKWDYRGKTTLYVNGNYYTDFDITPYDDNTYIDDDGAFSGYIQFKGLGTKFIGMTVKDAEQFNVFYSGVYANPVVGKYVYTGDLTSDGQPIFDVYWAGYIITPDTPNVVGFERKYKRGKYVGEVVGKDGTYPSDGSRGDGYWYVKTNKIVSINEKLNYYYEVYEGEVWNRIMNGSEFQRNLLDNDSSFSLYNKNYITDISYGTSSYSVIEESGTKYALAYRKMFVEPFTFHGYSSYRFVLYDAVKIHVGQKIRDAYWVPWFNRPYSPLRMDEYPSTVIGGGYVENIRNDKYGLDIFYSSFRGVEYKLDFAYRIYKHIEKGNFINTIKAPLGYYPADGIAADGKWYMMKEAANKAPVLSISTPKSLKVLPVTGQDSFAIEGQVYDEDNDPVTITVTVGGVSKSVQISNTNTQPFFKVPFEVVKDKISSGTHEIIIHATDSYYDVKDRSIQITIPKMMSNNICVLVDELLFFNPIYEDYERDPIYADQYRYTHDPYYFENSLGQISDSGVWRTNAYESFSKVGHYQVQYRAKDNPVGIDNQFGDYRLWSSPTSVLNFFVHRKPIADFNINLSQTSSSTYAVNIINRGYDLDHQSTSNRGIIATEYQWKLDQDAAWTAGLPTQVQTGDILLIWQRVKDIEGVWSDPITKEIDTNHLQPPVAQFTVSPNPARPKETLHYKDTSYDPNGLALTEHAWRYRELPSGTWSTAISTPPISFNQARKTYEIELKVKNSVGLWSAPFSQTVQAVNTPPVADFTISPSFIWEGDQVQINGHGSDAEGDPLTYRYEITRVDGSKYMVLQKDFSIDTFNVPPGTWQVKLIVNDGYDDSLPVTKSFSTNPISIDGFVSHTERWNENRIKYNQSKTGTDDSPRTYDVFFPGEKFVLKANTVGDVDRVDVQIMGTSYSTVLQHQSGDMFNSVWTGDLWNEEMFSWEEQHLIFRFTLTATNGTQKVDDVIIKIVPDEYWRQHNTF